MCDEIKAEEIDEFDDFDTDGQPAVYEVWILDDDSDFDMLVDDGYAELTEAQKCFEWITQPDNFASFLESKGVSAEGRKLRVVIEEVIGCECDNILDEANM